LIRTVGSVCDHAFLGLQSRAVAAGKKRGQQTAPTIQTGRLNLGMLKCSTNESTRQLARSRSGWSSAFAGLEVFLSPAFQAGFLFGTIDSAFFQDFELGRHYFL